MPIEVHDRVREFSTTTGTGSFTLGGAINGFVTFASKVTVGNTVDYTISMGSQWEVGTGTLSGSTTLARTTVIASSNSGSLVNFSAGTKEVTLTVAAYRLRRLDQMGSFGECQLQYVSATQIKLARKNGRKLTIAGSHEEIPSAGVTAANTSVLIDGSTGSLAASSCYYVSAYMNSGTMTLAFWLAPPANRSTDSTYGHEIITGQPNHSLVGIIGTNASSQFVDNIAARQLRSWYNRKSIRARALQTTNATVSSVGMNLAGADLLIRFCAWSDENPYAIGMLPLQSSAIAQLTSTIAWTGSVSEAYAGVSFTANQNVTISPHSILDPPVERGIFSAALYAFADTATVTVYGASSGRRAELCLVI